MLRVWQFPAQNGVVPPAARRCRRSPGRGTRSARSTGLGCRASMCPAERHCQIRDSIVVSISACHAEDPGSIPGRGVLSWIAHHVCNVGFNGLDWHRCTPELQFCGIYRAHTAEGQENAAFQTDRPDACSQQQTLSKMCQASM